MQFLQNMLMNHKNFHFTQIPDKTNDIIFLKSPKTMFWAIFGYFCSMGIFSKKIQLCQTQLYMGAQHHAKSRKKLMNQSQENLWTDRKMDKPYFIRPLWPKPGVQKSKNVTLLTTGIFLFSFHYDFLVSFSSIYDTRF